MAPVAVISGAVGLVLVVLMIVLVIKGASARSVQHCPKDHWTSVINQFGTGYPKDFHFEIVTEDGSQPDGEFVEKKYFWIFPLAPRTGRLQSHMVFHRDWINAKYVVLIKPTKNVTLKTS